MPLTTCELEQIKKSHKESAMSILEGLGVDVKNPLEFQQDMAWVRIARKFSQSMITKAMGSLLVLSVIGDRLYAYIKGQ